MKLEPETLKSKNQNGGQHMYGNRPFYSCVLSCQAMIWSEAEGDLVAYFYDGDR